MIVNYHQLEQISSNGAHLYTVSYLQMEEHLRMLASLTGGQTDYQITFDDGHLSCYQYALPLLAKHSFRAVFFLTASWIEKNPNTMTWRHVRELLSLGHQVQSHSWSHPFLTHCPDEQLKDELIRSRLTLEDKLGVTVDSLAAPYGRWDTRVLRACHAAGYSRFFTSDPWLRPFTQEGLTVCGRLSIRKTMTADQIKRLMLARGPYRLWLQTPFVMKQTLRHVIGDGAYHRLWLWLAHGNEKRQYET